MRSSPPTRTSCRYRASGPSTCPRRFRDRAPRIESTDEGDFTVFEGRRTPVMAINSIAGKSRDGPGIPLRPLRGAGGGRTRPGGASVDQDRDGIVAEVLYGGGPLTTADRDLHLASHAAYNDWLADYCAYMPRAPARRRYIPFESPAGAVAEIRRGAPSTGCAARCCRRRSRRATGGTPTGRRSGKRWSRPACPRRCTSASASRGKHRFDGGPAFFTDLVMTKMEMAGAARRPRLRRRARAPSRAARDLGRGVHRLAAVRRRVHGPRVSRAPLLERRRSTPSCRASTCAVRSTRPSSRIPSACANGTRSASTTSCGRATTRTARAPTRRAGRSWRRRSPASPRTRSRQMVHDNACRLYGL